MTKKDRNKASTAAIEEALQPHRMTVEASFIDNMGIYTFCGYNRLNGFVFRVFGDYKKKSETSKPNKPNP